MEQLRHENLISMLKVKETKHNLYIFMEFCGGGDLAGKLKKGKLNEEEAL